jgi:hypothetical protein
MKCCARPSRLAVALILVMAIIAPNSASARHSPTRAPVLHKPAPAPVPFDKFIKSVVQARYSDYCKLPGTKVESEIEFEKMKKHILHFYDYYGRKAYSTFMADGRCFDCLIYSFPLASSVASPPPQSPASSSPAQPSPPSVRDPNCPKGGIPVERLTLERLVQWRKLEYMLSNDGQSGGDAEMSKTPQSHPPPHNSETKK